MISLLPRRLLNLGVEGDLDVASKQATEMGVAYLRWRGIRLDVFVPSIDFYEEARKTRAKFNIPGIGAAWVLSAETIAVFKLLFFRPKDILDLEKLVLVQKKSLNRSYIRGWIVSMVGEEDERVLKWDVLVHKADKAQTISTPKAP